jgi:hypothetical protein
MPHSPFFAALLSEYGLGGGSGESGGRPAESAAQAAAQPYWGVFGPYKKSQDPWQSDEMRTFMHYFFRETLEWLKGVSDMVIHIKI